MKSPLFKCVILLFAVAVVTAQSQEAERGQGLLTIEPYWRQALGGTILSLPSVQAQSAVVALDGGSIRAYSTSGTHLWTYSARGRISPYVTRSPEGTSYFSRLNRTLIAVNRTGRELWRRDIGNPLSAKIITGWDGRIFVPSANNIFCFTASGTMLWKRTFEGDILLPPKLDRDGGIIFALVNNTVYQIDPFGNTHVWIISKTPAELLSIDEQQIMAVYTDGTLEVLGSAEDWYMSALSDTQFSLLPNFPTGVIAAINRENYIAAVLNDGRVSLMSLDERKILWTGDSHIREMINNGRSPEMEAEMLFDERGIYILSKNGAAGFSHDGRRLWYILLQNAAAIPAFGDDGVLYFGGRDWILYAYKIEDRALPSRNSLFGITPEGSYGTGTPVASLMTESSLSDDGIRAMLSEINSAVNDGMIGDNELLWKSFLLTVSASNEHIQLRVSALHLLGLIGSRETVPWLVNIFRRDTEPVIRAAAASAIGAIGVDPEGIAIQTFIFTLSQSNIRDEQVLTAIASATGALCRFSGPPLSETGIRILNILSESIYPSVVRRQANREIASLR